MGTTAATRIQPLADRVVVKALEESEQMRGGLYIPDTAKEKPSQGEVVAVGPGKISTVRSSSSCARATSSPWSSKRIRNRLGDTNHGS